MLKSFQLALAIVFGTASMQWQRRPGWCHATAGPRGLSKILLTIEGFKSGRGGSFLPGLAGLWTGWGFQVVRSNDRFHCARSNSGVIFVVALGIAAWRFRVESGATDPSFARCP